jgi:hypothetical protein
LRPPWKIAELRGTRAAAWRCRRPAWARSTSARSLVWNATSVTVVAVPAAAAVDVLLIATDQHRPVALGVVGSSPKVRGCDGLCAIEEEEKKKTVSLCAMPLPILCGSDRTVIETAEDVSSLERVLGVHVAKRARAGVWARFDGVEF